MQKRNKIVEFIWNMIGGLIIAISFTNSIFAANNTATFSVTCYMPQYVTTPSGEKVLADSEKNQGETNIAEALESHQGSYITEYKPALIQQQEEIFSEDNKEMKIITTVCAR